MQTLWFQEVSLCSTRVLFVPPWDIRSFEIRMTLIFQANPMQQGKCCWVLEVSTSRILNSTKNLVKNDLDICDIENYKKKSSVHQKKKRRFLNSALRRSPALAVARADDATRVDLTLVTCAKA